MMNAEPIQLFGKNGTYVFEAKNILSLNGRFGSVFRGIEIHSKEKIIVKFFSPQRSTKAAEFRFKTEALYSFGRDDIQDALDFVSDERGHFLIKNYVPGKTLKKIKTNKISLGEWKVGLISLLDTLRFLHKKNIVHGDIKPANIIWPETEGKLPEKPVLIDFGLARLQGVSYEDSLFSFVYSPPEQMLGFNHLMGPQSDFFALGVTMYECISDELAYDFDMDSGPFILEQAQLAYPLQNTHAIPDDWFTFISYMCQKPMFKKPHNQYSRQEQEELLLASMERRPKSAERLIEMAMNLSTGKTGKSFWRIFG